jgi:hypothetical protein
LTAFLYRPVVATAGLEALIANGFVAPTAWPKFFGELLQGIPDVYRHWRMGLPALLAVPVVAFALIGIVVSLSSSWALRRTSLLATMYIWCAAVLLLTHRVPYTRVWLWALPLAALLVGLGAVATVAQLRPDRRIAVRDLVLGAALVLAVATYATRAVPRSRETGTLRDGAAIAATLDGILRPLDRVLAPTPANAPLEYHFIRAGMDTSYLSGQPRPGGRLFFVLNTGEGFVLDSTAAEFAELVAEFPAAEVYILHSPLGAADRGAGR